MKITSVDIQNALVRCSSMPFFLRANYCVVRNVSWGLFNWGEADIIALTKAGFLTEGEIKLTKSDLVADFKKFKWEKFSGWERDIKRFYYIIPIELKEYALSSTNHGIICYKVSDKGSIVFNKIRESVNNKSNKLPEKQVLNLLRLGTMKAWRM